MIFQPLFTIVKGQWVIKHQSMKPWVPQYMSEKLKRPLEVIRLAIPGVEHKEIISDKLMKVEI